MMKKIIPISLMIFFVIGCTPHLFTLNNDTTELETIYGLRISKPYDNIDTRSSNSIYIKDSAITALALDMITQLDIDITVELRQGEGLRFALRSVSNNYGEHPAIYFDYTTRGSSVYEDEKQICFVDSIRAYHGEKARIRMKNNAEKVCLIVDCDTVSCYDSGLPNTEYLIIETLSGCEALLSGIIFSSTNSDYNVYLPSDDEE